jgi:general secretion pathway protein C
MEKGRFKGYQLSPSGNQKLFNELGLEPGDIVTAVNGINIDRPEKGLNALQNLVSATEVTVTLLRDGSEITLQHQLAP